MFTHEQSKITWFVVHYLIPKFAKCCFVSVLKKPAFLYKHTLGTITNLKLHKHKKYRNIAEIVDGENASKFHNTFKDTMILKRKSVFVPPFVGILSQTEKSYPLVRYLFSLCGKTKLKLKQLFTSVFREHSSRKTVCFSEQIMSSEKHPSTDFRGKWKLLFIKPVGNSIRGLPLFYWLTLLVQFRKLFVASWQQLKVADCGAKLDFGHLYIPNGIWQLDCRRAALKDPGNEKEVEVRSCNVILHS